MEQRKMSMRERQGGAPGAQHLLSEISPTLSQLKSGEIDLNEVQRKERHISEVDPQDLVISVVPSGFPSLDDLLFLKQNRPELIIVGGRPSSGKSALMFQMAAHISKDIPVHIFSCEMDFAQIVGRLMAGRLNKSLTALQLGYASHEEMKTAHAELCSLKYHVDDSGGLDIMELCDRALETQRRIGTKAVFVDYLQLLHCEKGNNRNEEISFISRTLKSLAKTMGVPIIVGSQLNRGNVNRGKDTGDFRPDLADLRDSGAIEQDADVVVFVHREVMHTGHNPNKAEIIVAKNRNGATKTIAMDFTAHQCRFIDNFVSEVKF